jgi:phosphoglucosamine mutase
VEPDGRNINLHCGSTAPELLARTVVEGGYRLGVAYDGDGDRAIFVDASGRVVDGDAVMLLCAKQMKKEGRLADDALVATVMSNIGLELALRQAGIDIVRCAVGDKYVMEEMTKRGLSLGGEQSGHVIFSDHLFTGDGLATSLHVLRTMAPNTGRELALYPGPRFACVPADKESHVAIVAPERARQRRSEPEHGWRIERVLSGLAANPIRAKQLLHLSPTAPELESS